jgi:signal peptidase I
MEWARLTLEVGSRLYRALFLSLLVAATVPMLWSWSSYVVRSGSMEPSISVGDVAVARPFASGDRVAVGRVAVFEAPSGGGHGTLIHRVVEDRRDGTFTTAGDANPGVDTAPVTRDDMRAQARILVPYVGRPFIWAANGDVISLLLFSGITIAAFVLPARRWIPRRPRRSGRGTFRPRGVGGAVSVITAAGVAVAAGAAVTRAQPTDAAFTARTANASNTWTVAKASQQLYDDRVMGDAPYTYYRLDESGGAGMLDSSGNNAHGSYVAVASYRTPGALPNNTGYSIGLNGGTGRLVSGGPAVVDPSTYTVELWFKTTTKLGGKLVGFESTRNATSATFDRHVFMRADGRLVYAGSAASGASLLTSAAAYNNGGWHHLVLTATPRANRQDAVMYVDGQAVASGSVTRGSAYSGWWRVGHGSLPSGSGYPPSSSFHGSIDNVAGYQTRLGADRVGAHYAAR